MSKATARTFDINNIDPKAKATFNQFKLLGYRFRGPDFKAMTTRASTSADHRQAAVVKAVIYKYHQEVSGKPLTQGDVQVLMTKTQLPKKYRDCFDPDAAKQPAETPKPRKKVKASLDNTAPVAMDAEAVKAFLKALPEDARESIWDDVEATEELDDNPLASTLNGDEEE